jgi:hypothetical protein
VTDEFRLYWPVLWSKAHGMRPFPLELWILWSYQNIFPERRREVLPVNARTRPH